MSFTLFAGNTSSENAFGAKYLLRLNIIRSGMAQLPCEMDHPEREVLTTSCVVRTRYLDGTFTTDRSEIPDRFEAQYKFVNGFTEAVLLGKTVAVNGMLVFTMIPSCAFLAKKVFDDISRRHRASSSSGLRMHAIYQKHRKNCAIRGVSTWVTERTGLAQTSHADATAASSGSHHTCDENCSPVQTPTDLYSRLDAPEGSPLSPLVPAQQIVPIPPVAFVSLGEVVSSGSSSGEHANAKKRSADDHPIFSDRVLKESRVM